MIKVYVKKQSTYPISTPLIKKKVKKLLEEKGIKSDADLSVAFVGENKMISLARKYLKENNIIHNVLSFPFLETDKYFIHAPDNIIHLGDIIVCFPKALEEAKKEGRLIKDKVIELVEHGALHLLGEHHE
ncbi:MAG: seg [Microgenomates group bacterium GW2011_GWC1_37_8]|uniref:Putative rRNA maturation factor n=1 Tax=Candidatus Woesebacteria bacterium GW2011_GWB1_38_8 TaxID=1618570 RepID=A0A0G0LAQ2_9BACT|nr:MAG: seg [Microgenomates group bacterium GW2011_GWC1_37_8]KKQ84950.1 MAG: putative rRNA maturation factor [Candidatus Woesebacteria bacterium GW2011_GWB1_38_8]